ncbi:hypothetical protein TCSYLVIO_001032 [Trypanosoma cruzi]|nr:hypothetical protein TCSYLVIO_001032 [Trypanosoma cruzi]
MKGKKKKETEYEMGRVTKKREPAFRWRKCSLRTVFFFFLYVYACPLLCLYFSFVCFFFGFFFPTLLPSVCLCVCVCVFGTYEIYLAAFYYYYYYCPFICVCVITFSAYDCEGGEEGGGRQRNEVHFRAELSARHDERRNKRKKKEKRGGGGNSALIQRGEERNLLSCLLLLFFLPFTALHFFQLTVAAFTRGKVVRPIQPLRPHFFSSFFFVCLLLFLLLLLLGSPSSIVVLLLCRER